MVKLLIAGGGTGGHLFPGVAVAEEFLSRDPTSEVLFVGSGRPVESEVLQGRGLASRTITSAGLKGRGLWGRLRSLASLPVGLVQSLRLILEFRPDFVIGVGGYVSGPVGVAAWLLRVPLVIQEQNSIPGLTNRWLGRLADMIFIAFEAARKYFPEHKTRLTGNPIRREIAALAGRNDYPRDRPFTLLVAGGSQGSHAINLAAVEAVRLLKTRLSSLEVIHQTGENDFETVKSAYETMGLEAEVRPFFQDMARLYLAAGLVVCRAGALTVAEVAAMGRPAIFIPLPTAADNHQEVNARGLAEAGAAEIILQSELTPERLADLIAGLARDEERRAAMSLAATGAARPRAVQHIYDLCQALLPYSVRENVGAKSVQ
ncbi:MAG: undecaprenyldiphospho-muramoylpentapeptide beta-N-acetylglucosaminyltransferase [Thermodesulfobacteriota bacterium]